jgi:hypothetical protein
MEEFFIFLKLGFLHITDLAGYDHILFVIALCTIYNLDQWKNLLIIITFFTLGHSITLALAALKIVNINSDFIEFLIPITIFMTCVSNLLTVKKKPSYALNSTVYIRNSLALFFGLIHGLGFSNYLRSLLGSNSNIIKQLLAFNIGLEIGQILIVFLFMVLQVVILSYFKIKKHYFTLVVSSFVAGITVSLIIDKWFF